jgi:hypothetical protein
MAYQENGISTKIERQAEGGRISFSIRKHRRAVHAVVECAASGTWKSAVASGEGGIRRKRACIPQRREEIITKKNLFFITICGGRMMFILVHQPSQTTARFHRAMRRAAGEISKEE